jgi:phosphate transport system permease protein
VTDTTLLAPPPIPVPEPEEPAAPPVPRRSRDLRTEDVGVLIGSALAAVAAVWLVFYQLTLLSGAFGFVVCTVALFLVLYWSVNLQLHGRLVASDRLLSVAVGLGAMSLAIPLAFMMGFLVVKGWHLLSAHLFVEDLKGVPVIPVAGVNKTGGLAHAIVGTLEQVGIAALFGVPAGVMTAVFLHEVGGRFTRTVRTVVTAMSGLPSIMAGLFIYTIWVIGISRHIPFVQSYSGLAGAMALAILLVPSITRTTEEVLKVVPGGLREASMALGAPQWRTVWSVVLPTARTGILTAVVLGIARAVGETAPLLFTIFGNTVMNADPLHGPQESLPLFIWSNVKSSYPARINLAYTAALVLVIIVLFLFTLARVLGGTRGTGRVRSSKKRQVAT